MREGLVDLGQKPAGGGLDILRPASDTFPPLRVVLILSLFQEIQTLIQFALGDAAQS